MALKLFCLLAFLFGWLDHGWSALAIGITGVVALLLAGILAWNAEATTLTSAATAHPATNFSLVEKARRLATGTTGRVRVRAAEGLRPLSQKRLQMRSLPRLVPMAIKPSHYDAVL